MARRPPSPIDRFFSSLRDALLDTAEDILDDAEDAFRTKFQPPAPNPSQSPRPGTKGRSPKQSKQSARPKAQGRSKASSASTTSPGASFKYSRDHVEYMRAMMEGTHYGTLEIYMYCSQETIAAAYKSLARKYHPDLPTGDAEKMKAINEAHEILSDPKKRKAYDRSIGISRGN